MQPTASRVSGQVDSPAGLGATPTRVVGLCDKHRRRKSVNDNSKRTTAFERSDQQRTSTPTHDQHKQAPTAVSTNYFVPYHKVGLTCRPPERWSVRAEPSSLLLRKAVTGRVLLELQETLLSTLACDGAFVGRAAARNTAQTEAVVNPSHVELKMSSLAVHFSSQMASDGTVFVGPRAQGMCPGGEHHSSTAVPSAEDPPPFSCVPVAQATWCRKLLKGEKKVELRRYPIHPSHLGAHIPTPPPIWQALIMPLMGACVVVHYMRQLVQL